MPFWLRLLALITFACALAGLLSSLGGAGSAVAVPADVVPGILFFAIATGVSVMTWRRSAGGVFLMLILQLTQVLSVSGSGGRALLARCGPVLELTVGPGGFRIGGGLQALFADLASSNGVTMMMTYGTMSDLMLEVAKLVVGINLLPIYMAWLLWRHLGEVRELPAGARRTT